MKNLVLVLLISLSCILSKAQLNPNWDSLYQLNQVALDLVDKELDSAIKINAEIFNQLNHYTPDSLNCIAWNVKSNIAFYQGNYDEAIQSNLMFLEYAKRQKDTSKILDAVIIIGVINYYTGAYSEAKKYLHESINLVHNSTLEKKLTGSPYNTLGAIHSSAGNQDSAVFYYELAISAIKSDSSSTSQYLRGIIYGNLGGLYLIKENLDKAEKYLELGITFNQNIGRKSGVAWCSNKLGTVYLRQNKLDEAIQLFRYVDTLSDQSSTYELQKDNKYSIIEYYLLKGENDTALLLLSDFNALIDSVTLDKTKKSIQEVQQKYETEKKEAALQLSMANEARLAAENKTNKLYLSFAAIGLLILGLTFFFTIRNSRQKRQITEMKLDIKDIEMKGLMANQESESFAAMLQGQEKERERIAQDLHDRLGGTLAALKHSLRRPENKVDEADLSIIDEAVVEVRDIAHNLSSGLLEKQGLNVALEQLKTTIERSGSIAFNLYLNSSMAELGQEVALELFRIVQELTNNTLKHANASEISLQTSMNDQTFNLIYEDNGIGFDPKKVNGGIGLHNLKARVKKINGTLHIDSGEGRGTISIIELDLTT